MLIVKDLIGNEEALPDVQGLEVNEEINGDFSIAFTSFLTEGNAHSYPYLQLESIVELEGHEYRIKRLNEVRNRKSVVGLHVFFDLRGHQLYSYMGGTKSVDETFSFILAGSGWTFENVDVENYELLSNFGEGSALSLIRDACSIYNCEIQIGSGRHLKIYKQIGEEKDEQFRYKYNIKSFEQNGDSPNFFTVIKGFGAAGLEVEYHSPNVEIFGEIHADPVRDDRFTVAESLLQECKLRLKDTPDVSFDIELTQLGFEAGLGDQIWTIYEPMGIDLKLRVMAIKRFPSTNRAPIVTMSNKKEYLLSDQLSKTRIEIDKNKKETRSKIEQTNERINLEVERIDESIAAVRIQSDEVVISVQSLGNRVGNAEASLSIQAGQISSKVSYGDVMSAIVQSPESVKISAQRLDLDTIVRVNQELQLGYDGNGGTKAIKFNGYDTWIHTAGDGLVIDSLGSIVFYAPDVDFSSTNVVGLYARFG